MKKIKIKKKLNIYDTQSSFKYFNYAYSKQDFPENGILNTELFLL